MRKLKTSDLFALSRIVKKMDIKSDIAELYQDITGVTEEEKAVIDQKLSVQLMLIFIENLGSAEQEIYKLMASLTDKKAKEIEELEADEFIGLIKELFKQESFGSFLSNALK